MNKDHVFESDIDNQTGIKDVRNYMIGPVYPHRKAVEGEKWLENEFDR